MRIEVPTVQNKMHQNNFFHQGQRIRRGGQRKQRPIQTIVGHRPTKNKLMRRPATFTCIKTCVNTHEENFRNVTNKCTLKQTKIPKNREMITFEINERQTGSIETACNVLPSQKHDIACFNKMCHHIENENNDTSQLTHVPYCEIEINKEERRALFEQTRATIKNNNSENDCTDDFKKPLKILNVNCQSLCNKQSSFLNLIDTVKPHIIIGTESWLDSSIKDSEYFPSTFVVYRKDRKSQGGGVFIAIKQEYTSSVVEELDENCELLWTKIEILGRRTLYICSYYKPHVGDEESLNLLTQSLYKTSAIDNGIFVIGGDFNFPGWDWKTNTLAPKTPFAKLHYDFRDTLNDCGLTQLIDEPTRLDKTLDLMITNHPSLITKQEVIPGISDHEAVLIEIDIKPRKNRQIQRNIPIYKKANWNMLKTHIQQTGMDLKHNKTLSADELWQKFKNELETGIHEFIPHKMCKTKNSQPWVTKKIRKMIKQRDRYFKKFKRTKYPKYKDKYQSLKREAQQELRTQYWNYVENMFEPNENGETYGSMKRFWSYIKHRKTENNGIAPIMKNGKLQTSAYDRATSLNDQFKSVFSRKQPLSLKELTENHLRERESFVHENQHVIEDIFFTTEGIKKLLQNLDPKKACGPDNIQARVLKELAEEVSLCLHIIFQRSFVTGDIPKDWKTANIAPIFKKGQRHIAANYRPVSLTCISSKIMEHIVVSHIMKYVDKHNILYDLQHGFRSKRSCETQLISFVDDVSKSLENGQQTDVLIMDFSKAFDKVDHNLLCHKLRKYGINGKTNRWIENFLKDRTQTVVVEGESSDPAKVESGVPQGSVLGPTLFLLYINDIAENLQSTARLFADDTMSYLVVKSMDDANLLQKDLNRLTEWEQKNRMEFHPQKCNVISITRKTNPIKYKYKLHDHTLEHVSSAKYLGVTLNSDLRWDKHIDSITTKANKTLGFLKRNLKIKSQKVKEKAYKSLVRPLVEYACTVWDPHTKSQINQLEMVQRRGARFTTGSYHHSASVTSMLDELGWQSLQDRRRNARLTMMYKIKHNLVAISNSDLRTPTRSSRTSHPDSFVPISTTKDYRKFSFYPRTITDWNNLPKQTTTARTLDSFVHLLPC